MSVGVTAVIASKVAKMMSRRTRNAAYSIQSSSKVFSIKVLGSSQIESADKESKPELDSNSDGQELTTFEQNCIGVPFNRLFTDCDDIVYVLYNDKRCVTVEAVCNGSVAQSGHVEAAAAKIARTDEEVHHRRRPMDAGYAGDEDENAGSDVRGTLKYLEAAGRVTSSGGEH
ncbi:hypothetical protein PF008_g15817, partial [Phytophthora fragariae]